MAALLAVLSGCEFQASETLMNRNAIGEPERGKSLIFAYGCVACHQVPGLSGYPGNIGPPLADWRKRKFIAGNLPNEPGPLMRWIMDPQEVEPGTAMPDLGVSEDEARDMAAYLFTH